jgi:hypothetical protein
MSVAENRSLQRASSSCQVQIRPVDSAAYARGLYGYAGTRLEPASLHAWMIQRLMIDVGLGHADALLVTDTVLTEERALGRQHDCEQRHEPSVAHLRPLKTNPPGSRRAHWPRRAGGRRAPARYAAV